MMILAKLIISSLLVAMVAVDENALTVRVCVRISAEELGTAVCGETPEDLEAYLVAQKKAEDLGRINARLPLGCCTVSQKTRGKILSRRPMRSKLTHEKALELELLNGILRGRRVWVLEGCVIPEE